MTAVDKGSVIETSLATKSSPAFGRLANRELSPLARRFGQLIREVAAK